MSPTELLDSLTKPDDGYQVVERGQDFAVLQRITPSASGNDLLTNTFTFA